MIIQTLFNRAMLYDNQFDLIAGGDDVARMLTAIGLVQDWFELQAMAVSDVFQTDQTFVTIAAQDYTLWPAGLMRVDDLYLLDSNSNQVRRLDPIDVTGGYMPTLPWPMSMVSVTGALSQGAPREYEGQQQGAKIRWTPTPDAVYTIRGYGLWAAADYVAAADTFLYPDSVALALVPHASQVLRTGLDRDLAGVQSAAESAFRLLIKAFSKTVHTGPDSRVYSDMHDT